MSLQSYLWWNWVIMPDKAIDRNSLKINWGISSGRYYIEKQDENGIYINANRYHYDFKSDMPHKIKIVPYSGDYKHMLDLVRNGKIAYIESSIANEF